MRFLITAAVLAAIVVLSASGGPRPATVYAANCTQGNTGTLIIEIYDYATAGPLSVAGANVLIDPDPRDFELDYIVVDSDLTDANAAKDRDSDTGIIRFEDACSTQGGESYTALLFSLPGDFEDCEVEAVSDSGQLTASGSTKLTLEVDCTGIVATPTPVATATPALPATLIASTSPLSVSCNGTSVVNVQVRDAAGTPVKAGTPVAITTNLGTLSPTSGHVTNDDGMVYTFLTAPAATGGTATVIAKAGAATGTATVMVNCATAAGTTAAPPPTVAAGTGTGFITPPSTGDAGLMRSGQGPLMLLGVVVFTAVLTGAWVRLRTRA